MQTRLRELTDTARQIRRDIVTMLGESGSGHPGTSLSTVEIVTALYFDVLHHRPKDPAWAQRDRFIMSKGHGVPAQYAAMARAGYFSTDLLKTLRKLGSPLQGHPVYGATPGIEASTGSLGQGLSIGIGIALAGRLDKAAYRTYVLLGDGECNEGQVWEAAAFAAHHKLDTLTAIVDANGFQLDGRISDILELEPLGGKWTSFGWEVREIDGHDLGAVLDAFTWARGTRGKPSLIVARTVKGKGVSFMENNNQFHGVAPTREEVAKALAELA
ncbi:MAG: transketolase [Planctomycetes bacterium]|nr:transketolase [Planctomycetota bacterium]